MFHQPFTMQVAGPTQAGKSTFIKKLSQHNLIEPAPSLIFYIQPENSKPPNIPNAQLHHSLDFDVQSLPKNTVVIIDDMFSESGNSESICNLFTRDSHHQCCSVIVTTQNLYSYKQCKFATTINRNCKYLILFKSPRDWSSAKTVAMQMNPNKWRGILEAYRQETSEK